MGDNATPSSELSWSKNFLIGDRSWRLLLTPTPGYYTEHRSWAAWGVLVSELSFAGLLCAFLLILTGRAILDERRADMRNAIERNRFRLYCQPIVPLGTAEPLSEHYEILLRLLDDRDQLVIPGGFIPAAERYGIMNAIDRWVVRTTFRDLEKLFPGRSGPTISINLSGNSLNDDDLLPFLKEMISIYCIDPQQICFEITETAAIRNLTAAGRLIRAMRDVGGHFALDDFGTGLSSFAYLKNLPVDYLKIDGSLVRNISNSDNDRVIVETIHQLAHRLGIETIAEYAETPAALAVLRELGVDYAQGYALGRAVPLPLEDTIKSTMASIHEAQ